MQKATGAVAFCLLLLYFQDSNLSGINWRVSRIYFRGCSVSGPPDLWILGMLCSAGK
jgi:hypothetical protein